MRELVNRAARWMAAALVNEWNNIKREARAIGRVLLSGMGLIPLGYCLWQWLHHLHWVAGQPRWLRLAFLALIVFVIVLQRLGNGRGMAHGFRLWLLSFVWVIGLAVGTFAFLAILGWIVEGAKAQDYGLVAVLVILSIGASALIDSCDKRLKRAEEQTP
jgi:hypothetical protein